MQPSKPQYSSQKHTFSILLITHIFMKKSIFSLKNTHFPFTFPFSYIREFHQISFICGRNSFIILIQLYLEFLAHV